MNGEFQDRVVYSSQMSALDEVICGAKDHPSDGTAVSGEELSSLLATENL